MFVKICRCDFAIFHSFLSLLSTCARFYLIISHREHFNLLINYVRTLFDVEMLSERGSFAYHNEDFAAKA